MPDLTLIATRDDLLAVPEGRWILVLADDPWAEPRVYQHILAGATLDGAPEFRFESSTGREFDEDWLPRQPVYLLPEAPDAN